MAINLVPETLSSPEDEQAKMLQQLNATRAKQGGQQVNLPQQKGVLSQFGDMAKEKVMGDAVSAGSEAMYDKGAAMFATKAAAPGTASLMANQAAMTQAAGLGGAATGAGAMGAIGTAMPYVGAGLLAGKALGFFNNGGHVGPLYAADGSMPMPISKRNAVAQAIEEDRLRAAERVRAAQQKANYNKLLRDQDIIDRKVALDRQKADQAESLQNMRLDSAIADISYQYNGGMAGPLSKVKYKSTGGEVYELSYGGGPLKKEK